MHNALCHPAGPCAQRLVSPGGGAQRLVSPRGGPVHNALCHWGGLCARPCVTAGAGRVPVASWLEQRTSSLSVMGSNPRGDRVHNACGGALCHGGACAQRLIWGKPCAQRLVSPGGALRRTPCVMGGRVRNALCRATPCVTEGGPVHNALCHLCTTPRVTGGGACACGLVVRATDFLPVSHGLKSQGGACAQRLVSPRGGLCTTPCVATPCVAEGGPCTTPCVAGGACAQRLVSGRVPVA